MIKWISLFFIVILIPLKSWGQCFPDRHNTTWYDGWVSCEIAVNPNPDREASHWILYNLGYTYHLGQMHVWNTNALDYLEDGIQTAIIDISVDGINWTEVGEFEFEQAPGVTTYEGIEGPDLSGYEAKYLLITAKSNWGGQCYGLSEIRVDVHGITNTPTVSTNECLEISVFPNPAVDQTDVSIVAGCSSAPMKYTLIDITGRLLGSGELNENGNVYNIDLDLSNYQAGTYFLNVEQNGNTVREKIVKIR